jgi:hypothetical protein
MVEEGLEFFDLLFHDFVVTGEMVILDEFLVVVYRFLVGLSAGFLVSFLLNSVELSFF